MNFAFWDVNEVLLKQESETDFVIQSLGLNTATCMLYVKVRVGSISVMNTANVMPMNPNKPVSEEVGCVLLKHCLSSCPVVVTSTSFTTRCNTDVDDFIKS